MDLCEACAQEGRAHAWARACKAGGAPEHLALGSASTLGTGGPVRPSCAVLRIMSCSLSCWRCLLLHEGSHPAKIVVVPIVCHAKQH